MRPESEKDEHDHHMHEASKHSAYIGHDGKKDAPMPFNAYSPVGQPDVEEEGEPESKQGEKDAPQPFNAQKGKPFQHTGLTKERHGRSG